MTAASAPAPAAPSPAPNYGIDADRVLERDSLLAALRRRLDGRYAVDEFGGDPHLMDVLAPIARPIRVRVHDPELLPRSGPALLIANRGLGVLEPLVLAEGVRAASRRRLRVVGAPEVPVLGPTIRKLGAIGYRPDDVAAMLRAGHLVAAPLGPTWFRSGEGVGWWRAGEPPRELLLATLGFPVIPVAVRPGGPFGLPLRRWQVVVGEPLLPPAGTHHEDQLAAAELAEEVRDVVGHLLAGPVSPRA